MLPVEIGRAELLKAQKHGVKVTLLSAPSGYGKSTVLAQFARQDSGAVWIRLNEEAKDAAALLNDLAHGSRLAGVALPQWQRAVHTGTSRAQLLRALIEDVNAHEQDLSYCLDGGEMLSSESALLLSFFAERLGDGHCLILAQREGSAFDLTPFQERQEGVTITADQLQFTADDTAAAARQLGTAARSGELQTTYHGWPWGIMLALRTQPPGPEAPANELVSSVLNALPDRLARQLQALSVLEYWSDAAAACLDVKLPDGWIRQLQQAGLPMTSVGKGRYVPHDVVRDRLTAQLRQHPARWRKLHARAAQLAEVQDQLYSAIRHHVDAGQAKRAVRLAEQLVPRWYQAADWQLAERTLSLIPPTHLSAELRSIYALAVLETGDITRGQALLEAQLALHPTASVHFGLALVGLRTMNRPLMTHHIDAGLAVARHARDRIQLLRIKAVHHEMKGELAQALEAAEEAVERAERLGDASLRVATLSVKARVLQRQGHHELAMREFERSYQAGVQLGLPHRLMPVVDQLGGLYSYTGRTAEAARLLESSLVTCRRSFPLAAPTLQKTLGRTYYRLGRIGDGRALIWEAYGEFLRRGHVNQMIDSLYHVYFSAVLGQDRARALEAFSQVLSLTGEDRATIGEGPWATLQEMHAYAAYTAGDLDRALAHLNNAAATTLAYAQRTFVLTEVLRGEIHRRQSVLTAADARALRTALDTQPEDLCDLRTLPGLVMPLLQQYVARGWDAEYFQRMITELNGIEPAPPAPLALHLTTFGTFKVTLNGHPVKLGHTPALEALTYWLLHPNARQDELADHVWGHGDLKRARQSAQVARSTINAAFRKAAAQDAPVIGDLLGSAGHGRRNPQWVLNPGVQLASDVQAFLNSRSADDVLRTHPDSFLAGSESEWVVHYRDVLRMHAVEVLRDAVKSAEPTTALTYLVRAADLTQDREAYERVQRAAQSLGQTHLSHAAQQAVLDLECGEPAALGTRWNAN
ncbi:hypothetical protein DFI_18360 (plasmid) [Deinococcus ficus]|uniref:MalT-like TPR region domain-containing protein n=1 Tax=Deinococcus ficus TaxID=317577 RepID=A0A221T2N4_9DEIO|nr:hypothetical protein DFI_18360 [Deinococcus ficus]